MTVHTVISCNGYWDNGRMPCRGSLTTGSAQGGQAARVVAARAGWSWQPPRGDLCPAHTRIERERASS